MVAVCAVLTESTSAVNETVLLPEETVTLRGTLTALLLLAKVTPTPAAVAAELIETAQFVFPEPMKESLSQESAVTEGVFPVDAEVLFSVMEACFVIEPSVAESVTVFEAVTAETFAEKSALVAPEGTVTEEGTVISLLLLERFTTWPVLSAADVSVTTHVSCPAPVMEDFSQLRPESDVDAAGVDFDPLPCSFTVAAEEESTVARVSWPVESASAFGLK